MGASNAVLAGSFTLAYWCVLVAALLPYVCASLAKSGGVGKSRRDGGFDNHDPRAWLAQHWDGVYPPETYDLPVNHRKARQDFSRKLGRLAVFHWCRGDRPSARRAPGLARLDGPGVCGVPRGFYCPVCGGQGHCAQPGVDRGLATEHRHPAAGLALSLQKAGRKTRCKAHGGNPSRGKFRMGTGPWFAYAWRTTNPWLIRAQPCPHQDSNDVLLARASPVLRGRWRCPHSGRSTGLN